MKAAQPKIITIKDHPSELAVLNVSTPAEAFEAANARLPTEESPLKGVICLLDEDYYRQATAMPLSEKYKAVEDMRHNVLDVHKMDYGHRTMYDGVAKSRAFYNRHISKQSPLILQFLSAAHNINGLGSAQFYMSVKNVKAKLDPHYDADVAIAADKKSGIFDGIKAWSAHNKFMLGKGFRVVWNEGADGDKAVSEEKRGTLFWSADQVSAMSSNEQYVTSLKCGDMDAARDVLINKKCLKLSNAWQAPNNAIIIMPNDSDWIGGKYMIHSPSNRKKPIANQVGLMNRIDLKYTGSYQ